MAQKNFFMTQAQELKYKIAQMLCLGFDGKTLTETSSIAQDISTHGLGGVVLFDKNMRTQTCDKNIESPEQVLQLTQQLQAFAKRQTTHFSKLPLPLFIAIDYEGGAVNRLKTECHFPLTLTPDAFAKLTPISAEEEAHYMSTTLQSLGINVNFAPLVDLNVNPENPIIGKLSRSFSDLPEIVIHNAYLLGKAYDAHNILFTYKHFPGHGSSEQDSHLGCVDVSTSWQETELVPYQELLKRPIQPTFIMTAHVINRKIDPQGLPATLSYATLTGLLREKLGFQGIILADDLQMSAIAEHYGLEEALSLAVSAGVNMFIFGNQLTEYANSTEDLVEIFYRQIVDHKIERAQIEASFQKILCAKQQLARNLNLA